MNNNKLETNHELLFQQLIERLTKKKSEKIFNVEKAYEIARELHKTQFRQSGEPYIIHPVIVASYLEKLDFDTDVIAGAILHDVVEDCDYTVEQIEKNFNHQIAEIVDGVTAFEKTQYKQEMDSIFDNSDFLKPSLESKTYHKLLKIGKKNRFAFYIKFADRLHNLQTINAVEEYKKLEKVKETEKWILPICELLKTSFFYYAITNECFKIVNEKKMVHFLQEYKKLINYLETTNVTLKESLFQYISGYLSKTKSKDVLFKIVITPQLEHQVFESINKQLQIKSVNNIKASHIISVPTHDIYIVLKNEISNQKANELLFNLLDDRKLSATLKIIGYETDTQFNQNYFIVSDNNKNKFRIALLSYFQYVNLLNGTTEGTVVDLIDEENSNDIETEFIKVKTRSNEVIKIPSNSTLLDFAFKIHNDIGFSFKYGLINDSPSKLPHYTKLKDGDKVSVICETDPLTKQNKYIAQIRWLAYVKTETAKKALIRYFEKKYDTPHETNDQYN